MNTITCQFLSWSGASIIYPHRLCQRAQTLGGVIVEVCTGELFHHERHTSGNWGSIGAHYHTSLPNQYTRCCRGFLQQNVQQDFQLVSLPSVSFTSLWNHNSEITTLTALHKLQYPIHQWKLRTFNHSLFSQLIKRQHTLLRVIHQHLQLTVLSLVLSHLTATNSNLIHLSSTFCEHIIQ